ncbi:DMBT1 [Bugula neritina]|uniref:DMBT1 n=1 Tax=Bugula neritina TaxID=10212 RepID=A0A7J7J0Y6_BUGNE|nr:DMBT1 [Bugula neritina]
MLKFGNFTELDFTKLSKSISHNAYCVWNITVPSGDITLTVTELDVESCSSNDYDFLKIYDLETSQLLAHHCGSDSSSIITDGVSSSVKVVFQSDGSVNGNGWLLHWSVSTTSTTKLAIPTTSSTTSTTLPTTSTTVKEESEVCGGVLAGTEGNLTSPNYPNPYPHNAYCVWNITVPSGDITITVTELDVESCNSNEYDFLKIYDLETSQLLAHHCGSDSSSLITEGVSSSVKAVFQSDGSVNGNGWLLHWSVSTTSTTKLAIPTTSSTTSTTLPTTSTAPTTSTTPSTTSTTPSTTSTTPTTTSTTPSTTSTTPTTASTTPLQKLATTVESTNTAKSQPTLITTAEFPSKASQSSTIASKVGKSTTGLPPEKDPLPQKSLKIKGTLQSYVWVLIVLGVMVIVAVLISALYVKHKRSCHPSSKDAEDNHLLIEIEDTHI